MEGWLVAFIVFFCVAFVAALVLPNWQRIRNWLAERRRSTVSPEVTGEVEVESSTLRDPRDEAARAEAARARQQEANKTWTCLAFDAMYDDIGISTLKSPQYTAIMKQLKGKLSSLLKVKIQDYNKENENNELIRPTEFDQRVVESAHTILRNTGKERRPTEKDELKHIFDMIQKAYGNIKFEALQADRLRF